MTTVDSLTLEVSDAAAARDFYSAAFGLDRQLNLRASEAPTSGFRGFTLSLVADIAASKRFYVERGLTVNKSFPRKYVQFETGSAPVTLALYGRRALARDAGVTPDGSGSHRLVIGGAGPFTDPDGFMWSAS
jgi:catechol 2,3-dioxygenase-like lactoylglutathione lyase family enzyme